MKTKTITIILAFFLGGIGIHRFYLGQTKKGLLYLLFCWTYIPLIISLYDIIKFAMMDKIDFDARYNSDLYQMKLQQDTEAQRLSYQMKLQQDIEDRRLSLTNIYGADIANEIINGNIWLGMKIEHLIHIKGEPDKIEQNVTNTKNKLVYIYGNKSSGDIFTFTDGILTAFKDR